MTKKRTRRDPSYYDWNVYDVAEYLDRHFTTVYRWARELGLPHKRVGRGGYRFNSDEVKKWFDETEFAG